jgi:hypothetical protein
MATAKQGSTRKPAKRSAKPAARKSTSAGSRNGTAKRRPAKRSPAKRAPAARSASASSNGRTVSGTIKQVAGPAVAVGAAAAGVAGGLVIRARTRQKTVLGVPVPKSLGKSLSGIDPKSVAKSVGQASKRFAKTTKNVSKDLERAGDQAERIGKILD